MRKKFSFNELTKYIYENNIPELPIIFKGLGYSSFSDLMVSEGNSYYDYKLIERMLNGEFEAEIEALDFEKVYKLYSNKPSTKFIYHDRYNEEVIEGTLPSILEDLDREDIHEVLHGEFEIANNI